MFTFLYVFYSFCSLFLAFYVHFSASHLSQPLVSFLLAFLYIFTHFFSLLCLPLSQPPQPAIGMFFPPLCSLFFVCFLFTLFTLLCSLLSQPSQPAIGMFFLLLCSLFCIFFTHFSLLFLSQPSQPAIQPPPFSLYRFITSVHYFFNPTITCL